MTEVRPMDTTQLGSGLIIQEGTSWHRPIPRCAFMQKNVQYVQLLMDLRDKSSVPPQIEGLVIPVLAVHPAEVTSDGTDHKTLRGTFDQNGRPTKLYDGESKIVSGYKRTYVLKNHNRGENFRFGKWLFCLEGFETYLIHYYSKTHPHECVRFRDVESPRQHLGRGDMRMAYAQPPSTLGVAATISSLSSAPISRSLGPQFSPMEISFVVANDRAETQPIVLPPIKSDNKRMKISHPLDDSFPSMSEGRGDRPDVPPMPSERRMRSLSIKKILPERGSMSRENGIKIFGEGFTHTSVVYWNHRPAATALISDNELWCFTPHAQANNYPSAELWVQDFSQQRSNSVFFYFVEEQSRAELILSLSDKLMQIEDRVGTMYGGVEEEHSRSTVQHIQNTVQELKEEYQSLLDLERRIRSIDDRNR
ncbi:hypothetical protein PROFUN_09956 [Planoprotostelium fungivorum]|uniref:IPT/TIG domain-containing protein n=1 Tax=Planoprotostelium fungivorum TaxID=1890364 RepID=A0A2P6MSQ2_9EUKA|nr:hypothetical protein PROFUN_16075 [Planoprotostelium fungivorum]PRP83005.1 hypothetical protein PROFUN_09956 [Planoprotostelium fungivorum]